MSVADGELRAIFPGDSRMSAAMREHDWGATALGCASEWPDALRIPVGMMLTSRFEMWLGWGPELAFLYNDAYIKTLGTKHPSALGRPMRDVWREVFAAVEDRILSVMRDGVATWDKALMLILERSGHPEETYHTFSYSPLHGASGRVEGLMCIVTEETERVIGERRLDMMRSLATALLPARSGHSVAEGVRIALRSSGPRDFAFGFLHLFDDTHLDQPGPRSADPMETRLRQAGWPFDDVRAGGSQIRVALADLLADFDDLFSPAPQEALLVPVGQAGHEHPSGCLVLGLNPLRRGDPEIAGFAGLLAGQIAGVLAAVDTHLSEAAETRRLQELFAQSPSFMAILRGPEHRFEMVNPAYRQLVGNREVVGLPVRDALPDIREQGFFELLDRVYASGDPFVGQSVPVTLRRTPDAPADHRVLDFVFQPIRNAEDVVGGIFVEGIDVTTAHDAVAALRDSERQFRTFAQAVPNHVWTATPDGALDWFNDRIFEYSGRDFAALAGAGWASIVHLEDIGRAGAAWAHALSSGEPYEIEFRIRRADGAYRWHLIRALPLRDEGGGLIRWIGTNTDIDERKRAEAESIRDFERVWTLSPVIKLVAGTDGLIEAANPAWTRVMGWSAAETIGRQIGEFVTSDAPERDPIGAAHAAAGGAGTDRESTLRTSDGGRRRIAWNTVPEKGMLYAFGRDITAQRVAEEALRQSQKMEAVGQLTGGIAHDFNNLLQGITGSLDLVQKRLSQGRTGELERFISGAMTSANRASALTHRLLAFSRRQPLDPRPVRANPLIASMEDLLRRTLGERIALELVLAGGLWVTLCDPNQLESGVLNLAINARDAMPEGGTLTIETGNAHLDHAYAAQHAEVHPGQYVCVSVTDSGIGMSPDTIARAFEPFFTTKPIGQGTGLGLSMIYGFARQSNGHAKIYSEPGRGTTFKLYLPRHGGAAEEEDGAAVADHGAPAPETGEVVLVVEDEAVVRGLIVEVLNDLGYRAIEAADGPKGLELLQSPRRIDLLITDVGLPGLNGRQVADAGRALRPGLKVLFMTGYAENAALASGFLEQGMAMVTKPFAMEALATRVRQIIEEG